MMRSAPVHGCVLAVLLTALHAPGQARKDDRGTWKDLFDGKTLSGWKARAKGDVKVVDGEIHILSKKANLWLVHEGSFTDFEFEAEARMPKGRYNSGLGFRCTGAGKPKGYQCEIDGKKSGWIYAIGKGWVYPKSAADKAAFAKAAGKAYKEDAWNKFRIRCEGDRIRIWINDVKTTDVTDKLFARGAFALQHHGKGDVHRFRNIRVKELKPKTK